MQSTAAKMKEVQTLAEGKLERGDRAGADATLKELMRLVQAEQLPLYKRRVDALPTGDGRELYVTLPAVVKDLLPKFSDIYTATGDGALVQSSNGPLAGWPQRPLGCDWPAVGAQALSRPRRDTMKCAQRCLNPRLAPGHTCFPVLAARTVQRAGGPRAFGGKRARQAVAAGSHGQRAHSAVGGGAARL